MTSPSRLLCAIGAALILATPVGATDLITQSADGSIRLSGGVGLLNLDAKEYVYMNGDKGSQLNWESKGVTLYTASVGADLPSDWSVTATLNYGDGGNGHMVDYDWIPPFNSGEGMDDWSDRSIHPDTRLKYYFDGSLEVGKTVYRTDAGKIGAVGGFRYTDVRWDAYGGSYIYSTDAPRDTVGDFPDGERGISYRQRIPVFYVGLNGSATAGRFGFSGGINGGVTSGINDIDHHWARTLRFDDRMDLAPVVMLNAEATYSVTEKISLYLSGNFENVFRQDGDNTVLDSSTGEFEKGRDVAGASFRSLSVSFGVKGRF